MPDPLLFPPEVVEAEVGTVEACPVLTRVRAFVVDQGVVATLQFQFLDRRTNNPMDLTTYAGENSIGASLSMPGTVTLRLKELVSPATCVNELLTSEGAFWDAMNGIIRVPLTADMVLSAGIYQLGFGIMDTNGQLVLTRTALLSVERSLFEAEGANQYGILGPPSLGDLRMALRDSSATENLLLQDTEFGTDQLVAAISRPLMYFNEQPPPLQPYSTRNFPFREMWLRAIIAQLYTIAAAGYRRNTLPYQAGGVTVDDRNKEQQYLAAAQLLEAEWKQFVVDKKIQINTRLWMGSLGSQYGTGSL